MKKMILFTLMPVYAVILCFLVSAAFWGSKTVTVVSENAAIKQRRSVIIDPGHGGVDGGATSCTGILESALNLEISKRLNDLMHLLGINTIMVRETDISIHTEGDSIAAKKISDLKQRVKLANETENALLVSIHQNYYSDQRYSGAQIFYAETTDSDILAKKMQSALVNTLNPGSRRQAKKASGIYLMDHIQCTGILVECGFLSNLQEEDRLRSKDYQLYLCCVIASVCSDYLFNTIA